MRVNPSKFPGLTHTLLDGHNLELYPGIHLVNERLGNHLHAEVVILDGLRLLKAIQQDLQRVVDV